MGRYYNGDIEGKFWFAVQSSNDADFFGGYDCSESIVIYEFEEEQTEEVKEGIKKCEDYLGKHKKELDEFFIKNSLYNEKLIVEKTSIETEERAKDLLKWYARLELGNKILKSLQEKGQCYFEGEA